VNPIKALQQDASQHHAFQTNDQCTAMRLAVRTPVGIVCGVIDFPAGDGVRVLACIEALADQTSPTESIAKWQARALADAMGFI
jgi:hypothetical protein